MNAIGCLIMELVPHGKKVALSVIDDARPPHISKRGWAINRGILVRDGKLRYTDRDVKGTAHAVERVV